MRVDFYLLPDVEETARRRFCCRLAYRAVCAGKSVHVLADADAGAGMDELMWDYPPDQFLPHAPADGATAADPVTIGPWRDGPARDAPGPAQRDVLINLGGGPADLPGFERVAEVVLSTARAEGRTRYRHYRERGYPLFHHDIGDWE